MHPEWTGIGHFLHQRGTVGSRPCGESHSITLPRDVAV
jgi:hypothetical protein